MKTLGRGVAKCSLDGSEVAHEKFLQGTLDYFSLSNKLRVNSTSDKLRLAKYQQLNHINNLYHCPMTGEVPLET